LCDRSNAVDVVVSVSDTRRVVVVWPKQRCRCRRRQCEWYSSCRRCVTEATLSMSSSSVWVMLIVSSLCDRSNAVDVVVSEWYSSCRCCVTDSCNLPSTCVSSDISSTLECRKHSPALFTTWYVDWQVLVQQLWNCSQCVELGCYCLHEQFLTSYVSTPASVFCIVFCFSLYYNY